MTALHLDSVSGATFNGKVQVGVSAGSAATLPAMTNDGTNISVNANPNGYGACSTGIEAAIQATLV